MIVNRLKINKTFFRY